MSGLPQDKQRDESTAPIVTQENDVDQQQQQDQDQAAKKPTNAKKADPWAPQQVVRGAGADVMNFRPDVLNNIQPGLQQMLSLPTLDPTLHQFDLVPSRFHNNFEGAFQEVQDYLIENIDQFTQTEFPNFFGSCACQDSFTPARFSIYTYVNKGQIVFYLRQFDGCGIAFSRFFKKFNQQFGINSDLSLHTFEQPPTEPLTDAQRADLKGCSAKPTHNDYGQIVPAENAIAWAVDTIIALRETIVSNSKLQDTDCEELSPSSLILSFSTQSTPSIHQGSDAAPLPVTNEAQARMLDQAFSTLNGIVKGVIANHGEGLNTEEREKLQSFFTFLSEAEEQAAPTSVSPQEGAPAEGSVPKFLAFCQHPMLDVTVAAVMFVATAMEADLIPQDSVEALSPIFHQIFEVSSDALRRSNPEIELPEADKIHLSPFDKINHEKICFVISHLQPQ